MLKKREESIERYKDSLGTEARNLKENIEDLDKILKILNDRLFSKTKIGKN